MACGDARKSRVKLFDAFIAKAVYNLSSTRALIDLLHSSPELPEQIVNSPEINLARLPKECNWGAKTDRNKHTKYWKGYKLYLAVTDGDIPLSGCLTSASCHDSRAVISLMQSLAGKFGWVCDMMDSAYDAKEISGFSRIIFKRIPIIDHNKRSGEKIDFSQAEKKSYTENAHPLKESFQT